MRNCGTKTQAGVAGGFDSSLVNYTREERLAGEASLRIHLHTDNSGTLADTQSTSTRMCALTENRRPWASELTLNMIKREPPAIERWQTLHTCQTTAFLSSFMLWDNGRGKERRECCVGFCVRFCLCVWGRDKNSLKLIWDVSLEWVCAAASVGKAHLFQMSRKQQTHRGSVDEGLTKHLSAAASLIKNPTSHFCSQTNKKTSCLPKPAKHKLPWANTECL